MSILNTYFIDLPCSLLYCETEVRAQIATQVIAYIPSDPDPCCYTLTLEEKAVNASSISHLSAFILISTVSYAHLRTYLHNAELLMPCTKLRKKRSPDLNLSPLNSLPLTQKPEVLRLQNPEL